MADWDWLKRRQDLIPLLIVHDRTAANQDGDDPKDAIIFPSPLVSDLASSSEEDLEILVTKAVNLIGQIMGYVVKLKQEICESNPTIIQLEKHKFALKHIGKYTLILRGITLYPDTTVSNELNYIYEIFCCLYGGFLTSDSNTKEIPDGNPDTRNIRCYLPEILHTLANSLLSSQSRIAGNSFNPILSKSILNNSMLNHKASLLLQSYCSHQDVVGGLIVYDSQILCVKQLGKPMVDIASLLLLTEAHGLGIELDFPIDKVTVKKYKHQHCKSSGGQQCYLVLFGHGLKGFSLALVVSPKICDNIKATDIAMTSQWQKPCTHIKHELFKLTEASISCMSKTIENQPVLIHESPSGFWNGSSNHLPNKELDPQTEWMSPMAVMADMLAENSTFRKITLSHYSDPTTLAVGDSDATGQKYRTEKLPTLFKAARDTRRYHNI